MKKKCKRSASPTPAQHWARKRNFTKKRISAMLATCKILAKDDILTASEQFQMEQARNCIAYIMDTYKAQNSISKARFIHIMKR